LSVMDSGLGYPLYDLTSSGLNQGYNKGWRKLETNKHRVATINHGDNFGLITIDWERADPLVALQIRDVAGDVTIQEKLPLSWLQPGAQKIVKRGGFARLATGELLTADEVQKHLKKKVTVDLEVVASGASKTMVFL